MSLRILHEIGPWPVGLARQRCALDDAEVLVLRTWTYAGTGYTSATPGAELAVASAARAREHHGQTAHAA
jgi:hypothetical protein